MSTGIPIGPLIEGILCSSEADAIVDVINPSNGRRCLSISAGCQLDVDRAVASARRAFEEGRWSDAAPSSRKRVLHRWADLIAGSAAALDAADALEMGKPIRESMFNAVAAADLLRFHAEAIDKIAGDVYPSDSASLVFQRMVPRGVVAAVIPWNFPTFNAVLKLAPALASGNCVVVKPSELASQSSLRLAQLALEAGVPPGVLNVVLGLGEIVGKALGLHGDVDMVTFTGSTEVGKRMLCYAGQSNMKVVMSECGGKSPQIIFDDGVDLDAATETISRSLLINQGQVCSVGSRLLVQRSIETAVVERITTQLRNIVMGDALDLRTTFGPLATERQCTRVMQYVQTASEDRAELLAGGRRVLTETGGYFVEPTVFRAPAEARIAREEIFGPVLTVIPFENEAEAVRIANSTIYGLLAYVWTANLSTGLRMAKQLRSSVLVNSSAPTGEGPGHAFCSEPARQSGVGTEGGLAGMQSYMRRQLIWMNHSWTPLKGESAVPAL